LPYTSTIFGNVIDGLEVIEAMSAVDVEPGPLGDADGIPKKPIRITSIQAVKQ
jgi:cyclophilin family peptidyl-prolyl cis-trans isomerase